MIDDKIRAIALRLIKSKQDLNYRAAFVYGGDVTFMDMLEKSGAQVRGFDEKARQRTAECDLAYMRTLPNRQIEVFADLDGGERSIEFWTEAGRVIKGGGWLLRCGPNSAKDRSTFPAFLKAHQFYQKKTAFDGLRFFAPHYFSVSEYGTPKKADYFN